MLDGIAGVIGSGGEDGKYEGAGAGETSPDSAPSGTKASAGLSSDGASSGSTIKSSTAAAGAGRGGGSSIGIATARSHTASSKCSIPAAAKDSRSLKTEDPHSSPPPRLGPPSEIQQK